MNPTSEPRACVCAPRDRRDALPSQFARNCDSAMTQNSIVGDCSLSQASHVNQPSGFIGVETACASKQLIPSSSSVMQATCVGHTCCAYTQHSLPILKPKDSLTSFWDDEDSDGDDEVFLLDATSQATPVSSVREPTLETEVVSVVRPESSNSLTERSPFVRASKAIWPLASECSHV